MASVLYVHLLSGELEDGFLLDLGFDILDDFFSDLVLDLDHDLFRDGTYLEGYQ